MTRQEAIEGLKALLNCNYIGSLSGEDIESLECAISTMRKYQQIQEIYKSWRTGDYKGSTECMEEIGEVLKDGDAD